MAARKGKKAFWPAWRYHESAQEGRIFAKPEDVPAGWVEHPSMIGGKAPEPVAAPRAGRAAKPKEAPAPALDAAEARRQHLLMLARAKHGHVVPAESTIEELTEGLGGEAGILAAEKALNGAGR